MAACRPNLEALPPRLDKETTKTLEARIEARRGCDLDLDGSAVTHVDSHGVCFLLAVFGVWAEDGRQLRLINAAPVVEDVFRCLDLSGTSAS